MSDRIVTPLMTTHILKESPFISFCTTFCKSVLVFVIFFFANFLYACYSSLLTLKVLVTTIDAQWEGMGDVGSARYEPALLPPCPTIRVLSYSN